MCSVQVYYTLNGKEYVTPERLQREIKASDVEAQNRAARASAA